MTPNPTYRRAMIQQAIYDLKDAREHLRLAGAINAHAAACRALKSADGALRHARRLEDPTFPPNRRIRKPCPRRPSR